MQRAAARAPLLRLRQSYRPPANGPQGPSQITKCRGFFTIRCDLVTLVNALFTTFGELCACRSPVSILYRIVHGFRTGVNLAPEEAFRRSDFARRRPFPAGDFEAMPASIAGGNRQAGVSMNSKRSYLETLNAGRQRRAHSSIEQLNQSLETLQQRIGRNADRLPDRPLSSDRDDLAPRNPGRWDEPARRAEPSVSTAARARRCRACRKANRPISRWRANTTACAARRTASLRSGRSPAS